MRRLNPAFFLLMCMVTACFSCQRQNEDSPNIIYILADDMGYGDIGALNPESGIPTPHLDEVAAKGIIFSDAHSPSAVCTPTRYGVLTGRYCFRTRLKSGVLTGFSKPLIDSARLTVAEVLRESGYYTACIGKWHLGLDWPVKDPGLPVFSGDEWAPESTDNVDYLSEIRGGPADHGFDFSFIIPASLDMTPYVYIRNRQLIAPVNAYTEGQNEPRGVFWRAGDLQEGFEIDQVLQRLTDEAVRVIHEQKKASQPFFIYLALTAPHTPWLPSVEAQNQSEAGIYGDFVHDVDRAVGAVVMALHKTGQEEETLLIFTSDNGAHWTPADKELYAHRANAPFSGMKSDVWEGGHHVPFLLQWPAKVEPGTVSGQLTVLTDLMATCADLTDYHLPPDAAEDSYSMLPAILGQDSEAIRPQAIMHSISGMFAIRMGEFKYIEGRGSGGWSDQGDPADPEGQLYHMMTDPQEQNNLFTEMPDMVRQLKKELSRIQQADRSVNRQSGQNNN